MGYNAITTAEIQSGEPIKQSLMQKVKDNFDALYGTGGEVEGPNYLTNASFEIDSGSTGYPDGWDWSPGISGTFLHDTASPGHGAKCARFYRNGASTTGGMLTSNTYTPVAISSVYMFSFMLKQTAATALTVVRIYQYKKDQTACSTAYQTVYTSTSNPTSWTRKWVNVTLPSDCCFVKINIRGPEDVDCYSYFDDVRLMSTLGPDTVGSSQIVANGVDASEIAANAVGDSELKGTAQQYNESVSALGYGYPSQSFIHSPSGFVAGDMEGDLLKYDTTWYDAANLQSWFNTYGTYLGDSWRFSSHDSSSSRTVYWRGTN